MVLRTTLNNFEPCFVDVLELESKLVVYFIYFLFIYSVSCLVICYHFLRNKGLYIGMYWILAPSPAGLESGNMTSSIT